MIDNKYNDELKNINIYISKDSVVSDKAKILFNSVILGKCEIKDDVIIGPNSIIVDSIIGKGASILNSYITDCVIGERTTVGPYAHLREMTNIGNDCRIGNFVEIKKSKIKEKTIINLGLLVTNFAILSINTPN